MNTLTIIALLLGLLVVGSILTVNIVNAEDTSQETEIGATESDYCGGSCSSGNTCGNPSCGIKVGKSCGCSN